ncbi:MAG: DUF6056 family protein [Lachnospiraceae bacterium]|nr:DUF6056 family protein [Lachnospiraceae bacterium]
MKDRKKSVISMAISMLPIVISMIVIVPIIIYSVNSLPAADDFTNAISQSEYWERYSSRLVGSLRMIYDSYRTVSGPFYAVMINYLCTPFLRWGIVGIRVFNMLSNILFFLSVYFFIRVFFKHILNQEPELYRWFFCGFVVMVVNGFCNSEVYTWYCVQAGYVIPLSTLFITMGLYVYSVTKKKKMYICTSVFAFLLGGSSLNLAALSCGILFLFGVYSWFYLKRKKESLTIFIAALIGTIVNLASPGNYSRHDYVSEGYNVAGTLKNSCMYVFSTLKNRIFKSPYGVVCLAFLLLLLIYMDYSKSKMKYRFPLIGLFVVFAGVVIVDFPVMLGYSTDGLPERGILVQDVTIYLLTFLWIIYFTGWIKRQKPRLKFQKKEKCISTAVVLTGVLAVILLRGGIGTFTTAKMITSFFDNSFSSYIDYEESMLDEIMNSSDEDVVITRDKKRELLFIKDPGLSTDPENWVNNGIAKYYGKKSINLIYLEE